MTFQPGVAANPNGRPKGSRNKRTEEILIAIRERGDKDPLDALSEIITTTQNPELKVSASNILAPYLHSKCSTTPAPRFVPEKITVPEFHSIDEAENFLASLPVLLGKGELDSQTALELSTLTRNWISARHEREELQLKLEAQGGTGDRIIRIEGGLPVPPGCENLIMPHQVNGPELNGHTVTPVIDHQPATESVGPRSEAPD